VRQLENHPFSKVLQQNFLLFLHKHLQQPTTIVSIPITNKLCEKEGASITTIGAPPKLIYKSNLDHRVLKCNNETIKISGGDAMEREDCNVAIGILNA